MNFNKINTFDDLYKELADVANDIKARNPEKQKADREELLLMLCEAFGIDD